MDEPTLIDTKHWDRIGELVEKQGDDLDHLSMMLIRGAYAELRMALELSLGHELKEES